MGYNSLIDSQVQNLMRILGQDDGLAPYHTYIETTSGSYNTTTRTYSTVDIEHSNIPAVPAKFTVNEIDNISIKTEDIKFIIAALDLPVTPKSDDKIRTPDGRTYNIVRNMSVPGESVYILQSRITE